MSFALLLILSVGAGEIYSGKTTIDGIGEIALPPGQWILEYAVTPEKRSNNPDVYVFKKQGDRLERLTFQRFGPHIAGPIGAYFDSIGDSISNGIPIHLLGRKSEHNGVHILRDLTTIATTNKRPTCIVSSYVYTSEAKDPWMSHAFVNDRDGWVLVCIHASPFAISPETVEVVFGDSRFAKGIEKDQAKR